MSKAHLTIDDYLATLRNTRIPTVVTEGRDDYSYFRLLEEKLSHLHVSLLPVGGKPNVLELFRRRKTLGRNDIAFMLDKDLWVINGIPDEYQHRKVVTSDGYSIENDYYRDADLERFLLPSERGKFIAELTTIIAWQSHCLKRYASGGAAIMSHNPHRVLAQDTGMRPEYAEEIGFTARDEDLFALLTSDYRKYLRGKTLIQLLARHLNAPHREVKFGYGQLIEICATGGGPLYQRVCTHLQDFFGHE